MTGRIITGSQIDDCFVFLNLTQPIWAKSKETPRIPSPSEGASSTKLIGHCVWPLSIPLPRTATVPSGSGEMRSFRLPETFLERNTRVSVQYDLTINILRGKLRTDNRFVLIYFAIHICNMRIYSARIKTAFGYIPSSRPEAPSILRQLAYQQFLPIPGPTTDPEGWKTLRPVTIRGTMFKAQQVETKATVCILPTKCNFDISFIFLIAVTC